MLRTTRLRRWRARHGYSLAEVSGLTGASEAFLSRVERGLRRPSAAMRVRLAQALDARVSDLFEVEPVDDEVGERA